MLSSGIKAETGLMYRINMGTRFMATKEAPIHDSIKQELVKASERDTALIMRTFKNTARIFKVVSVFAYVVLISELGCSSGHRNRKGLGNARFQENPAAGSRSARSTSVY